MMREAIGAEPMAGDDFHHFDLKQGRNIPFSPHAFRGSLHKIMWVIYLTV